MDNYFDIISAWLEMNMGNIVVGLILFVILFSVIRFMIRRKRSGGSTCGCGCSGCTQNCSGHR